MKSRVVLLIALALVAMVPSLRADVLWDQSDFDPGAPGFFNSVSGEPPFGITHHAVNHITVAGDGWLVDTITTYYSALDAAWGFGISEGHLHLFEKTGPLPDDTLNDPTISPLVPMTAELVGEQWIVTATALNLSVTPGEYWAMITPVAPSGMWGPEIHLPSMTLIGDATASFDPYGMPAAWFNFNPGVDASILIEGTPIVVSATDNTTWGTIKSYFQK